MTRDLVVRKRGGLMPWRVGLEERTDPSIGFDEWVELVSSFAYQGVRYSMPNTSQEEIGADFGGLARSAFKGNGIVFACMAVRMLLFSEARFQFRRLVKGRPGDLFGDPSLGLLESPGPGMTTGDLLARMILHADLGGNWFGTNRYGGVTTLQPNWMTIVAGNPETDASLWDPRTTVAGYSYQPGGPGSGEDPILFFPEEIAHFAPIPDPEARFRGMSWLTPVIREVMADRGFTDHKISFLEHGATPNVAIKVNVDDLEKFMPWVEKFREQHEGSRNAAKTLFLNSAMDVIPIGANMQELDFKSVQGAGETRIAAAAGVPPVVVGLSEGLQGSALNAGNYQASRRRFADMTMRPLWRNAAGSLARIVNVPGRAELWYDDRDIAALQEDVKDAAEILQRKAATMSSLILSGYEPDSVTNAVAANDLSRLAHSGYLSVQLQPRLADPSSTAQNGNGNGKLLPAKGRDELISDALRSMQRGYDQPHQERQLALELHIHDERSIDLPPISVDLPESEPPVVNVTVEAPEPSEPPVVNVTVEQPRSSRKTVDFGDGRTAVVTEEETDGV